MDTQTRLNKRRALDIEFEHGVSQTGSSFYGYVTISGVILWIRSLSLTRELLKDSEVCAKCIKS